MGNKKGNQFKDENPTMEDQSDENLTQDSFEDSDEIKANEAIDLELEKGIALDDYGSFIRNCIDSSGNLKAMKLRRKFDSIHNVDDIFYFLQELVDELRVCENANSCPIFPELHHLDLMRMRFDKIKTDEIAQKLITNQIDFKKFLRDYEQYIKYSKQLFNKIFALKVSNDTKLRNHEIAKRDYIDSIVAIGKSGLQLPMNVVSGMQQKENELGAYTLEFLTKEDKEKAEQNKAYMQKRAKDQKIKDSQTVKPPVHQ